MIISDLKEKFQKLVESNDAMQIKASRHFTRPEVDPRTWGQA